MGVSSEQDNGNKELVGKPSGLTCPDCGGSLWEKQGDQPIHFRCRTGHAYSPETLLAKQSVTFQAALWAGLRSLEENAALARRMQKRARELGNASSSRRHEQRAREADAHAAMLRSMLQGGGADMEGGPEVTEEAAAAMDG